MTREDFRVLWAKILTLEKRVSAVSTTGGGGSGLNELTGDVTAGPGSGAQAATIANDAVTNAKAANMAQATFKLRAAAAGTGDPIDGTPDQASTILDSATDPFLRTSDASSSGEFGPLFSFTPPIDGDYAWVNQGSASVDVVTNGIFLRGPLVAGPQLRIGKKAAPSTPYTITAAIIPALMGKDYQSAGLIFRESSSGKIETWEVSGNTVGLTIGINAWNGPTNYFSSPAGKVFTGIQPVAWLRIADNGTNRLYSYSPDGQHWFQFFSESRTNFLTADEVGFFVNEQTNTYDVGLLLLSMGGSLKPAVGCDQEYVNTHGVTRH